MRVHKVLLFFLSLMLLGACREDSLIDTVTPGDSRPRTTVEASITGFVISEDTEFPIENAVVTLGGQSVVTDDLGFFRITDLVNEDRAILTCSAPNYFSTQPVLTLNGLGTTSLRVKLKRRGLPEIIPATAGGIVGGNETGMVVFSPGSFINPDGSTYNGTVSVYRRYIDPTRPDILEVMSGNLMADNMNEEEVLLTSYSMLDVVLETTDGRPLQINQAATVTFPIPSSLRDRAPATIPLWHYDKETGVWEEEGSAELEGNTYVGEVMHFSLWNCDVPQDFVQLCGSLVLSNTSTRYSEKIRITNIENGDWRMTYFNQRGQFCGPVPRNQSLRLEIINDCGAVVYSRELGKLLEFTELDIDPEEFVIIPEETVTITLRVVDCDNLPNPNATILGYMLPILDSQVIPIRAQEVDEEGKISLSFDVCGEIAALNLIVYDHEQQTYGSFGDFDFSDRAFNLGDLSSCENEFGRSAYLVDDDTGDRLQLRLDSLSYRLDQSQTHVIVAVADYEIAEEPGIDRFRVDWYAWGEADFSQVEGGLYEIEPIGRETARFFRGETSLDRNNSFAEDWAAGSYITFTINVQLFDENGIEYPYDRLVMSGIME